MSDIRISVGAVVDSSFTAVFGQVESMATKARAKVAGEAAKMGKAQEDAATKAATAQEKAAQRVAAAQEKEYQKAVTAAEKANARIVADFEKAAQKEVAAAERAAQQRERADQKAFDARIRAAQRAHDAEEREIMRTAAAAEKAAERAANASGRSRRQALVDTGRNAAGNFGAVARGAGRLGMEIAQGAGANFGIGSLVGKSVGLEKTITDLLNSASLAAGREVKPGEGADLTRKIRQTAEATGQSTEGLAEGLSEFVAKSSDLETGVKAMGDLARLSRATGTNMKDMVSAAGEVNTQLKDGPDKAERLVAVMKTFAKQGAQGAVEIKDLARYAGRLASSATRFEGGFEGNVSSLGMLAQLARHGGGATTASQATNAAARFSDSLIKNASKLKKAGVNVVNEEGDVKTPERIIQAVMLKTGGDVVKLTKLFPNIKSFQALEELAKKYREGEREGEGGGLKAINKEMGRYTKAMTNDEVDRGFAASMKTSEAKVAAFNAKLEALVANMAEKVLPAMERGAPAFIKLAEATANLVAWAAENPGKAITGAIVASIGKAALGTVVAAAVKRFVEGGAGGGGSGAGAAGAGKLGAALGVIGAGVTGYAIGSAIANDVADSYDKGVNTREDQKARTLNMTSSAYAAQKRGSVTREDQAAIEAEAASLQKRIAAAESYSTGGHLGSLAKAMFSGGSQNPEAVASEQSQARKDKEELGALKEQLGKLQTEMGKVHSGILKVVVTNASEIGGADKNRDSGDVK